mmetsp:Transcript_38469/g.69762  ORF Transcript_38469/g.69762 Transcript_38469/m.69762 type:complete len:440 (-) Transcript_38469:1344-2663(-)
MRSAVVDEPLKERHIQVEVLRQPVDCRRRAKLLVISNEDNVLRARVQRRQDVSLQHLRRLLHDDHFRPELLQQLLVFGNGGGRHSYNLHFSKHRQFPVPFQGRAVVRVALQKSGELGQQLPGCVVRLQEPLAVGLSPQPEGQPPEVLFSPVQTPQLRAQSLRVLLHPRQPSVVQLLKVVLATLQSLVYRLHIQLAVVVLEVCLLFFVVAVLGICAIFFVAILIGVEPELLQRGKTSDLFSHHRCQLGQVGLGLEPILRDLGPELVVDFQGILWQVGSVASHELQVALVKLLELGLPQHFLGIGGRDRVPVDVSQRLRQLRTEQISPIHEGFPGLEVLSGRLNLIHQLLEVSCLHQLAFRSRTNTCHLLVELEDAFQELIQSVVGVAHNQNWRVPDLSRVLQDCLHHLEADKCLPRARRSLDKCHLICQSVLDGVKLRII